MVVSKTFEYHSPFFTSLHPCRDFENEIWLARILINYTGLAYLEQVTVFFNDLFFQKLETSDSLELIEHLGTLSIVDISKIIHRELTFTYKVNKNTFSKLSSATYFFWLNRDVAETTSLRGRFSGNFRLKSKRCMELSCMFDCFNSIGFSEIEDISEIEELPISSIYPIFTSFQIHTELSVEIAEQVEELKFSADFCFCPEIHTVLVADRHPLSDPNESDVLVKISPIFLFFFGNFA